METAALEISSMLGLFALVVLSFNFLLGMLLSTSYRRSVYWKHLPAAIQKWNVNRIHNWTAYVALALIFLHPVVLTFDETTKFVAADIFIPLRSSYDPSWVTLGVISFYAITIVIITTQKFIKRKLGFRLWKNIHLVSYFTALAACLHGIFLDPQLKQRSPDFFDGEKMLCELCLMILIGATVLRIRYHKRQQARLTAVELKEQEVEA